MRPLFSVAILLFAGYFQGLSQAVTDSPVPGSGQRLDTAKLGALTEAAKSLVYQYPDSALRYLNEVIGQSEDHRFAKPLADGKSWAGVAYYVKGEYDQALSLFTEALHLYRETQDHYGLSTSLNQIGLIYQTQQRYNRAIEYHRKGVNHAKVIKDLDRQSVNHFNIGLAYDEMGKYDSALHYLRISLNQSNAISLHRMVIMNLNRIGKVKFHLGEYAEAQTLYDSVLNYSHYQTNWEKCFALAGRAEVYDALGKADKAVASGLESLALAKRINAKWDIIHAAEILARTYAGRKDFERAYGMSLMMQSYKDSVFNADKEKKLNYLHLKENELAKARLEKENALQNAELKEKNFQIAIGVVVSVSLVLIILVSYSRQRQVGRLNTSLTATNRKIERQVSELNEANQAKNKLFSIISHDLRSPFTHLQGLLMLSRSGMLNDKDRGDLFKQLEDNFQSVSGTLESLLQWASSQMEGLKANPERLSVDALIGKIKHFWDPAIDSKQITCTYKPGGLEVYADFYQLKTVIRNILGNAIKFTPSSGSISISAFRRDNRIGISIGDNGVGMPASVRDSLFTFEKKNQRSGTLNEKGTGLGLMISQQLLEKNGGTIEVETAEGEGTTFTIWIPSA